jgi:hypothetical protein
MEGNACSCNVDSKRFILRAHTELSFERRHLELYRNEIFGAWAACERHTWGGPTPHQAVQHPPPSPQGHASRLKHDHRIRPFRHHILLSGPPQ